MNNAVVLTKRQRIINGCLSCPKPCCDNCLGEDLGDYYEKEPGSKKSQYDELFVQATFGWSAREVAALMNVTPRTVRNWRKKIKQEQKGGLIA